MFSENAMVERNFDGDLPPKRLEAMLSVFTPTETVENRISVLRAEEGFLDLKRGELYPEIIGAGVRLRRTIAESYGVGDAGGNLRAQPNFGCNGCIASIFGAVRNIEDRRRIAQAEVGDRSVIGGGCVAATPTYFRYYTAAQGFGVRFIGVPYPESQLYPVEAVVSTAIRERASLIIIASPENPSGTPLPDDSLDAIVRQVPEDVVVVLDRTCACTTPEVSTRALIERYSGRRFAVLHSFSKYHGMSHLRIGFAVYADDGLASETNRFVPFGLCLESCLRATAILQRDGELRASPVVINRIRRNGEIMREFIAHHPDVWCSDSRANYALVRLPPGLSADILANRLGKLGIFVLAGSDFPEATGNVLRLHVGGQEESIRAFVREFDNARLGLG